MTLPSVYQLPLFAPDKRCTKCGAAKPVSEFHRHPGGKDGCRSTCKACCHKPRPSRYAIKVGGPREEARLLRLENRKRCSLCHQVKDLDDFGPERKSGDGRKSRCRPCQAKCHLEWRERHPDYGPRYRDANADDRRAYGKRYRETNVERERERHRIYNEANRDKIRQYRRQLWHDHKCRLSDTYRARYYSNVDESRRSGRKRMHRRRAEHPEEVKQYAAEWRIARADVVRQYHQRSYERHKVRYFQAARKRRALKAQAEGSYTEREWRDLCTEWRDICLWCKAKGNLTADHVVPLSKGGSDYISNIQPLCKSCNSRKGVRTIDFRL